MGSLASAAKAAEQLHELSGRLCTELTDGRGDFTRLVTLADEIGEKGDVLAEAFHEVDQLLTRLVSGDGPVVSDPAASDPAEAHAETEEASVPEEIGCELRAIVRRLSDLERRLEEDNSRQLGAARAEAAGEDVPDEGVTTNGTATGREDARKRSTLSGESGNGAEAYDRLTREQLYNWAQEAAVPGRSRMSKDQLVDAHRREPPTERATK